MKFKDLTPPQVELVDLCKWAFTHDISDIHIEPVESGLEIRVRRNGRLEPLKKIPESRSSVFFEGSKSLLGFDMSKSGVPQDSRYRHPTESVDFRCNLMPVLWGEKLCLRLLERGKDFHLSKYPLFDKAKETLFRVINKGQGLVIVSGPTGSGKSTLLYSVLGSIDRGVKNINTVEDPVEYTIHGLNQIPVEKGKYEFSDALRALMRQDPDVIMVGEIRDAETAEAAIHAASTGHLVLTTVHANDASDIFTRLEGLGVPREPVELSLQFASAQRLVKTLCEKCKEDDHDSDALVRSLFPTKNEIWFTPKISKGCHECRGTGIKGRTLIFEYVTPERVKGKRMLVSHESLEDQAFEALSRGEISAKEAYSCFSD